MKANIVNQTVVAGEMKKNLLEIRYISRKTVAIQNQFKETHVTLIEDKWMQIVTRQK
jgi:hypothetical protein